MRTRPTHAVGILLAIATAAHAAVLYQNGRDFADAPIEGEAYGSDVGIFGALAIVGAQSADDAGSRSGAAYILNCANLASPVELVRFAPADGATLDFFGGTVAITADRAAVAATGDDDIGLNAGSVYLYNTTDPQNPALISKLVPIGTATGAAFGRSIAFDDGLLMVGASGTQILNPSDHFGAVYIFDASTGQFISRFSPNDLTEDDYFGSAVSMRGGIAAIGAYRDEDISTQSGAAYIYDVSNPAAPVRLFRLLPTDLPNIGQAHFGTATAVGAGFVAIGTPGFRDATPVETGAVHLFNSSTGQLIHRIDPPEQHSGQRFGEEIALSGALLVVGAPGNDHAGINEVGAAWAYDVSNPSAPVLVAKLVASGLLANDHYGARISCDSGAVIAGTPGAIDNSSGPPYPTIGAISTHILQVPAPGCAGDINTDGTTNAADFTMLAGSFGSAVPPNTNGDLNGDEFVDAADFTILAGDFGCAG